MFKKEEGQIRGYEVSGEIAGLPPLTPGNNTFQAITRQVDNAVQDYGG
jgi:hypothetical protein